MLRLSVETSACHRYRCVRNAKWWLHWCHQRQGISLRTSVLVQRSRRGKGSGVVMVCGIVFFFWRTPYDSIPHRWSLPKLSCYKEFLLLKRTDMGGKDVEVHWCPIFEPKPKWLKNLSRWFYPSTLWCHLSSPVKAKADAANPSRFGWWCRMTTYDNNCDAVKVKLLRCLTYNDDQWCTKDGYTARKASIYHNISPCLMLVRIWVWYANFLQHCVTLTAANPYRQLSAEFQALMEDVGK